MNQSSIINHQSSIMDFNTMDMIMSANMDEDHDDVDDVNNNEVVNEYENLNTSSEQRAGDARIIPIEAHENGAAISSDALSNYLGACVSSSSSAGTSASISTDLCSNNLSATANKKASTLKSWRTRDPVYALCQKRQRLEQTFLPPSDHGENEIMNKSISISITGQHQAVPKGNTFHIEAALQECKRNPEKVQMIQRAFDAAAFSVLRALQKQRLLNEADAKGGEALENKMVTKTMEGLTSEPGIKFLQTLDELGEAKMDALEIVSNKRKVPSSNTATGSARGAGVRTPSSPSPSAKKARVKNSSSSISGSGSSKVDSSSTESKMNKQHNGGGKQNEAASPLDNSNSNSNSNNSSDVVPAVQLAGYSNLDSRSTISRAILCAAASLTFKELTPNFPKGNMDVGGDRGGKDTMSMAMSMAMDINALNIPQNPNPENLTSTSTNANTDASGNIKKEDNTGLGTDTSLEIPSNELKSKEKAPQGGTSTSTRRQDLKDESNNKTNKKPEINMGAVIMSAEIFAKRSIEQVKSAVQRSERRRKWRMDCARSELIQKQKKLGLSTIHSSVSMSTHMHMGARSKSISNARPTSTAPAPATINPLDEYLTWKNLGAVVTDNEDEMDREQREKTFTMGMDLDDRMDKEEADNHIGASSSSGSGSTYVPESKSDEWRLRCLPRLLDVMHRGPGNVIYHDRKWDSRCDRIAQLLHGIALDDRFQDLSGYGDIEGDDEQVEGGNSHTHTYANYGPHLIITTHHDLDKFMQVLRPLGSLYSPYLKGLLYRGSTSQRRKIRIEHFTSIGLSGFLSSPYNVVVTSYRIFIQDYLHFCHIPFQAVVLDDGMSWLGTAHFDPNGKLGKVFDRAMWSKSDMHIGLAGVLDKKWNFSVDIAPDGTLDRKGADTSTNISTVTDTVELNIKGKDHATSEPKVLGLTARYKILVASKLYSIYRDTIYPAPASSLLSFFIPQFADVVKEEWDRSRIHTCEKSMDHIRSLLSRGVVVFSGCDDGNQNSTGSLFSLAMDAMTGNNSYNALEDVVSLEPIYPEVASSGKMLSISTDKMISNGKIVQSRRLAASWLINGSPIRYELGTVSLDPIMNIIRKSRSKNGYICEEIVPASSVLSVGNSCMVVGPSAFKTAIRCGRTFANEQGLRQHIAAMHAPPGTWLCRSCAIDCGTSQARTQHERSCTTNGKVFKEHSFVSV